MATGPWRPPALGGPAGLLGIALGGGEELQETGLLWDETYRIIASEWSGENLFDRLGSDEELDDLRAIADLTNPAVLHQMGAIDLVRSEDRLYGAGAGLIMASFAWPGSPSRFSDGSSGTYYTALKEETAIAETVYHDERLLSGSGPVIVEKTLIGAVLRGTLVDIQAGNPCPPGVYHPTDYNPGQTFGGVVRRLEGYGIVYDSVRHAGGHSAAVFRPPALSAARPIRIIEYHWDGTRISRVA